ncbi:MAG: SOS response-associated peptidase family protein [Pseudomonadota bacterium]
MLKCSRGLVIASNIGESKVVGKTKHQYLMQSQQPFLLGALYRKLNNGDYTCAIITRYAHPKMEAYHDKVVPLFLPNDNNFVQAWLTQKDTVPPEVDYLLNTPKLYPNLHVQRVKSYKSAIPVGNIEDHLSSDQPELLN